MNLTGVLQSVALTTLERVQAAIDFNINVDGGPEMDAYVSRLITDVSQRVTDYLGFHTLRAQRTETYELPVRNSMITLSAAPIDLASTFELRVGTSPVDADLDALSVEDAANYRVSAPGGWIRILRTNAGYDDALMQYARVKYTGGLGTTAATVIAAFPMLSNAVETQIKYHLQRGDSLGGNINTVGGGVASSFMGEYGLLKYVLTLLEGWRRHHV